MKKKVEIPFGKHNLSMEIGFVAKQSDGAVWAKVDDTILLATVVSSKESREDLGYFPLTCEYREHISSAGKIPGGFFKREGRPSEREILVSRIIDRSIRPLFPENYFKEIQVIVNVFSSDRENNPDVISVVATSLALTSSKIPFKGPIASVRVGFINNEYVINPTFKEMENSSVDMIISGTEDSIVMVEGSGQEFSEEQFIECIEVGHKEIKKIIEVQRGFAVEKEEVVLPQEDETLVKGAETFISERIKRAYEFPEKRAREEFYRTAEEEFLARFEDETQKSTAKKIFERILADKIRKMILETGRRLDGRDPKQVRPIECQVGLLPRTHGSALFTRGQTQCLSSLTLGTSKDEQRIEGLHEEMTKRFMLHYNFPPFSVGEVALLRGTSRREIGHGALAERSLSLLIPDEEIFPYTIRIVANILESNGSSSMATVCAGSLSLMDAGVPIKKHVAGVSLGLIKEGEKYILLTDIAGEEDHYGNLDLKIAGTEQGITGFQMDVKGTGITTDIFKEALAQAKEARSVILGKMYQTISSPRPEISVYAPRIISLKVKTDKIGLIIGPGGKTIKKIIEDTGAEVDISDDGTVKVYSPNSTVCEAAAAVIRGIVEEPEAGKIYDGTVVKIIPIGAFVEFMPGKQGLVHISELASHRVNKVEDVVKEGDKIKVKFLGFDAQGRIKLSRKKVFKKG